jgi:hypothetical protein
MVLVSFHSLTNLAMEMSSKSKTYYGTQEVVSQSKNLQGDTILTFADQKQIVIHRDILSSVLTPQPLADSSELRRRRVIPVVHKILQVCQEYNLHPFSPMNEVRFLFDMTMESVTMNVQRAYDKLWGKPEGEVTMQDVVHTLENDAFTPPKVQG